MLTRRGFAGCAICALAGFAATPVDAEAPPGLAGIRRTILSRMDGPTDGFETIVAAADIEPGFSVPRHIHPGVESAYIAGGGGVFHLDGEAGRLIGTGDVVQVAARIPHSLQNGDRPTRIISTYVLEKGQPIALSA